MYKTRFTGPLFIVGLGRSGTKLLRDLLNQNPQIGIPVIESDFIPYMINRFGNPPRIENDAEFEKFFRAFSDTTFYFLFQQKFSRSLGQDYIAINADRSSWHSVFEIIFRYYAPPGRDEDFIWGDKTPANLRHMKLLKELFPDALFLHIIRDPRDVCLSQKKTWGTSLYRAANRWREDVEVARDSSHQLGKDYMEVSYELLLKDPKKVISGICSFLNCDFNIEMTKLREPSENIGDARGKSYIVQNNMMKYRTQLSSSEVKRIEEIVYPVAKSLGYKFENDVRYVPLSSVTLKMLRLYNAGAALRSYIKENGFICGLRLFIKMIVYNAG